MTRFLSRRYKKAGRIARPVLNSTQTIRVEFGMALIQILDFDETNQVLATNVWKRYVSRLKLALGKKATIHQLTTMLSTSKNVLFPGHITTCMTPHFTYNPRWRLSDNQSVQSSAQEVSRWLWPENKTFLEVDSMVSSWWVAAFLPSVPSLGIASYLYSTIQVFK